MTRNNTFLSGKLVLATVVATGMAAAPVALNPTFVPQFNAAAAQAANAGDDGFAEEQAERGADSMTTDVSDNVYHILGTTREEAESADTRVSASAQYGPLKGYQTEVERGNLDAAAENLAAISERPITEKLVTEVNTELGVETRLTAQQIADAAARKQEQSSN